MTSHPPTALVAERFPLLDALRGFALLGVLLVHATNLAGRSGPDIAHLVLGSSFDIWTDRLVRIFAEDKAQSVFTALFGISFVIQFERLCLKSADPAGVYRRRLAGLLVIGLVHSLVVPEPDILVYFALGGFVLLLTRGWGTRSMAMAGILLSLAAMPTGHLIGLFDGPVVSPEMPGNPNFPAIYQVGGYLEIMQKRWSSVWFVDHPMRGLLTVQLYVIGRFMLGVAFIRMIISTPPSLHHAALKRAVAIGLMAGLLLTESLWMERWAERAGLIDNPAPWQALMPYLRQAGTLLLAAGYAALFALGWQSPMVRHWLRWFVPMGQMAVTNYLLQSVFLSLVFYGFGFGLLGRLGATASALLAMALFSTQCLLSHAWLKKFQYGPVEWLWRSWTYGKFPAWSRVAVDRDS